MSTSPLPRIASGMRTFLLVAGIVTAIVGLLILIWPAKTAAVGTAIVAVYAILTGLVYIAMGIRLGAMKTWLRVLHVLLGLLFVVAGIVAFSNLAETTVFLAIFVAVFIGITWIVEGVVALTTMSAGSRGWTIFFGIVSILAGISLLFSPMMIAFLWLLVGAAALAIGIVQIIRAIQLGRADKALS